MTRNSAGFYRGGGGLSYLPPPAGRGGERERRVGGPCRRIEGVPTFVWSSLSQSVWPAVTIAPPERENWSRVRCSVAVKSEGEAANRTLVRRSDRWLRSSSQMTSYCTLARVRAAARVEAAQWSVSVQRRKGRNKRTSRRGGASFKYFALRRRKSACGRTVEIIRDRSFSGQVGQER